MLDNNCNGVVDDVSYSQCDSCSAPTGACTTLTGSCQGIGARTCGTMAALSGTTGYQHSCAVMRDGTVRCWGYNGQGQLGNGTTNDRTIPVPVPGLTGAVELIDVEHLYAPGFAPTSILVLGTPGYNLVTTAEGAWSPWADRFAAAVLLSEMLTWHNPEVVRRASGRGAYSRPPSQTRASSRGRPASSWTRRVGPAAPTRRVWRREPLKMRARLEVPPPMISTT